MNLSLLPWQRADRPAAPGLSSVPAQRGSLTVADTIAFIVGIVVGVGIFRTPSLVAANTGSTRAALLAWVLGGAVSLVGALCYAELSSTYPHQGGDYHFLRRAYGDRLAFLFAWSRMSVIQTGAIAMQAFIIGDYATMLLGLGPHSASLYAAITIAALTAANIAGLRQGKRIQRALTLVLVLGLAAVAIAGLWLGRGPGAPAAAPAPVAGSFGLAMVFVLLTYGGWNEAAYLSAEINGPRRNVARALMWGIGIITAVYLLANAAYLLGLGQPGVAGSEAVAADLMRRAVGPAGATIISALIVVAALTSTNGTIFTGARTSYALGQQFWPLRSLGRWDAGADAPVVALLVQGMVALALVLIGTLTRNGFVTMVEYTAPVFWFFFLLVGVSLFVLRRKDAGAVRPFRVPLYPLTPLVFCAACAYMLRASLAYTGMGALIGVGVVAAGLPLLLLGGERRPLRLRNQGP
jgi:amino acid transporter